MNVSKRPHWLFPQVVGCAYQGVINDRFSENFACFVFLKHPFWDSPYLLPYYQQSFISVRGVFTTLPNIYNGSFFIFFIVMVFQNCQNQFQQCFGFFPSKLYWIFRRKHYGNEYFLWATKNVNCETTFQTWSRTEKKNYRPVSIFSDTSKIYERFFIKQLEEYFRVPLYKYHYGLRERYTIISAIPLVILNEENFWKCSWREP